MSFKNTTACILSALALLGCFFISGTGQGQAQGNPQGQGQAVEVGIVTIATQRVILTKELPGRTSAYLVAEVRPQVSGIIQKRLFEEGSDVKAGQVLYQIDPATYKAAFDSAKAALAKAQATLNAAKPRAQRYRDLLAKESISQQDYDDVIAAYGQSEADLGVAKAALDSARINLEYTKVNSPITGRIGKSSVTQGALVTANQPAALATVQQLDPIYVDVTQASAEMLRLRRALASGSLTRSGDNAAKVKLLFEDGTPYDEEGVLQFSDVTVDQASAAITMRAIFPNPNKELLPGMYVRAVLEEGVDEAAVLAPQQGVSRDNKGNPIAMVVDAEGKVEQRALTLERAIGNNWLVSSGLKHGDQLIVEGVQRVRVGTPVRAVPASNVTAQQTKQGSNAPAKQ